jgi:hypothetical protein
MWKHHYISDWQGTGQTALQLRHSLAKATLAIYLGASANFAGAFRWSLRDSANKNLPTIEGVGCTGHNRRNTKHHRMYAASLLGACIALQTLILHTQHQVPIPPVDELSVPVYSNNSMITTRFRAFRQPNFQGWLDNNYDLFLQIRHAIPNLPALMGTTVLPLTSGNDDEEDFENEGALDHSHHSRIKTLTSDSFLRESSTDPSTDLPNPPSPSNDGPHGRLTRDMPQYVRNASGWRLQAAYLLKKNPT